jgi:hypothetical protein
MKFRSKLRDLVQQIDYREELNVEAEELLLLVSDEFVDSVLDFSCRLAGHRNSPRLEPKDVLFHLRTLFPKLYDLPTSLGKDWDIKLDDILTPNVLAKSVVTNTSGEIIRSDGTTKIEEELNYSDSSFPSNGTHTEPAEPRGSDYFGQYGPNIQSNTGTAHPNVPNNANTTTDNNYETINDFGKRHHPGSGSEMNNPAKKLRTGGW